MSKLFHTVVNMNQYANKCNAGNTQTLKRVVLMEAKVSDNEIKL